MKNWLRFSLAPSKRHLGGLHLQAMTDAGVMNRA
jgi:hypothetical protein